MIMREELQILLGAMAIQKMGLVSMKKEEFLMVASWIQLYTVQVTT